MHLHAPLLRCPNHREQPFHWRSPVLAHACPPGRRYDLKVSLQVGLESLFLEETELRSRHHATVDGRVPSTGTISLRKEEHLLRAYALHRRAFPALRRFLDAQGGYLLHVDGTLTEGSPVVFVAWDEWSGLVLDTRVLPTEDGTVIAEFFRDLEAAFGRPCGLTSDMGEGIRKAAESVWPGLPHQLCQFHYVRALGKALFEKRESEVSRAILGKKVLAKLGRLDPGTPGDWFVFGVKCGKDLAEVLSVAEPRWARVLQDYVLAPRERASRFPFELTYGTIASRVWAMESAVHELLVWNQEHDLRLKTLIELGTLLRSLTDDRELSMTVVRLERLVKMFWEYREALGVGRDVTGSDGVVKPASAVEAHSGVESVVKRWEDLAASMDDDDLLQGVRALRESWEERKSHLFVEVRDRRGQLRTVERTNWRNEQGHREIRLLIRGRTRKARTEEEMTRHGGLMAVALNWGREAYPQAVDLERADIVREMATVTREELAEAKMRKGKTRRCRSDVTRDRHREPLLREFVKILKAGGPDTVARIEAWIKRKEAARPPSV